MKIAQFGRDVTDTGGGRVILETSNWMTKEGHEVAVITDVHPPDTSNSGLIFFIAPLGPTLKKWNPKIKALKIIRQFARMVIFNVYASLVSNRLSREGWITLNHNIEYLGGDIIILHNIFSREFSNDSRIPRKYLRLLNPVFLLRLLREKLSFRIHKGRKWIAVSAATKSEALHFIDRPKDISHINNGVNTEKFFPLDETPRREIRTKRHENEKFIMLFVGHEFEKKGLIHAIEALSLLPESAILKVIGGRLSNQATYERIAKEYGLTERVQFLGSKDQLLEHYQTADALVLPSAYETWALVGLEAMACGAPVLMTNSGGISEYLKDGINGYFIETNAKSIADKAKLIMRMGAKAQEIRKQARDTALQHSWQQSAEQYVQAAESVQRTRK